MAQAKLRCPCCGLHAAWENFDEAGRHYITAIRVKGLGRGRGFKNEPATLQRDSLFHLRNALTRALQQVEKSLADYIQPRQFLRKCPHCKLGFLVYLDERGAACPSCGAPT